MTRICKLSRLVYHLLCKQREVTEQNKQLGSLLKMQSRRYVIAVLSLIIFLLISIIMIIGWFQIRFHTKSCFSTVLIQNENSVGYDTRDVYHNCPDYSQLLLFRL